MLYYWLSRDVYLLRSPINLYGVGVALAVLLGYFLAVYMAKRRGIQAELLESFILKAVVTGIVFARLVFVLLDLDYYLGLPHQIPAIWRGGLSIHGAILGGLITAIIYCKNHKISLGNLADVMTPALVFGEAIGRLGCDVVGRETLSAPLALQLGEHYHHNIPFYTFVVLMAIGALVWKNKDHMVKGRLFTLYLISYSIGRLGIDYFREGALLGGITVAQVGSLFALSMAIIFYIFISKGNTDCTAI